MSLRDPALCLMADQSNDTVKIEGIQTKLFSLYWETSNDEGSNIFKGLNINNI